MQHKVLKSEEEIQIRNKELSNEITAYFKDKVSEEEPLIVVGVLKGAYIFTADLVRNIKLPLQIEFVRLSSYGDGTESSGQISAPDLSLSPNIFGKHILIVEDIVDTGQTALFFRDYLNMQFSPKSVKIASFLDKPSRRIKDIKPDFYSFEIEDKFVIGYGLDYAERYRELGYLAYVEQEEN